MEYAELKRVLGHEAASQLEDAVLGALFGARSLEERAALCRLMACLTAAVAHRATHEPEIAARCVADFSAAYEVLRAG